MAQKFYAVRKGRQTGLFTKWDDCKAQVQGYSGAVYKSFATLTKAQQYLWGDEERQHVDEEAQAAPGEMVAYVDGSYHAQKKRFAFGAVIFYEDEEYHFFGSDDDGELVDMRNVAGEIKGAERAMSFALEQGAQVLHIYHDYEGVARWCTGEWQAKKLGTQRYRQFYQEVRQKGLNIYFHKVKGHSGDKYNELADQLAKRALEIKG